MEDPSLIAVELERRQAEGPDPVLLTERETLQRRLSTFEKQQQRLIRHFREEECAPWELIKRELAQIDQEKTQVQARLAEIERRLAAQHTVLAQLDALETYCTQVSRQLERFDFDGKRLALEALDIQVTANGRDWHLQGTIPLDDAGVLTQTSADYDRRRHVTLGARLTSVWTLTAGAEEHG
jgi:hypothetical protein